MFSTVQVCVQPTCLKLTDSIVKHFLELNLKINNLKIVRVNRVQELFEQLQCESQTEQPPYEWLQIVPTARGKALFIAELRIYPLVLDVSYKQVGITSLDDVSVMKNVLNSFGKAFKNVSDSQIALNGFVIFNCRDTLPSLSHKLSSHYKQAFMGQVLRLFGNNELIGNPLGLVKTIGSGFKDLYEMPKKGFIEGPLEGGLGIVKGTSSLLKNTIGGAFSSVQLITGSLASGISQLSMVSD